MSFKDKVVIVTGASSGIGADAAIAFSNAGAHVTMVGRNEVKLQDVAAKCTKPLVIRADVSNDDDAKRIIDETIKTFGKLDILVNNAGLTMLTGSLTQGDLMKSYDTIMGINVRAVIYLTNLAVPHLIKTRGNVINISSVAAFQVPFVASGINYSISKAALNHFTICAATELGQHGVRVNGICPGPVKTDFLVNSNNPHTWDSLKKYTILDRVSEADEVTDLIMYLASDKARGITGSNFLIDNGVLLKRLL